MNSKVPQLLILAFLSFSLPAFSQIPGEPCAEAVEQYRADSQTFQNLTGDCQSQVGYDPSASVEDCPAVDRDLFVSMVVKMEDNRFVVCRSCQGSWPKRALGPGFCPSE